MSRASLKLYFLGTNYRTAQAITRLMSRASLKLLRQLADGICHRHYPADEPGIVEAAMTPTPADIILAITRLMSRASLKPHSSHRPEIVSRPLPG